MHRFEQDLERPRRTKGQALFVVLLVLVLVLAVGSAIVQTAALNTSQVRNNRVDEQLLGAKGRKGQQRQQHRWNQDEEREHDPDPEHVAGTSDVLHGSDTHDPLRERREGSGDP